MILHQINRMKHRAIADLNNFTIPKTASAIMVIPLTTLPFKKRNTLSKLAVKSFFSRSAIRLCQSQQLCIIFVSFYFLCNTSVSSQDFVSPKNRERKPTDKKTKYAPPSFRLRKRIFIKWKKQGVYYLLLWAEKVLGFELTQILNKRLPSVGCYLY